MMKTVICPQCHGDGEVEVPATREQPAEWRPCPLCGGKGGLPKQWQDNRDRNIPSDYCAICGLEHPCAYLPMRIVPGDQPICLGCFDEWVRYHDPEAVPNPEDEFYALGDMLFDLAREG